MSLLKEVTDIVVHYGEDRGKIYKEADKERIKIFEPFLRQSFIYVDVLNRTIIKLAFITNHLYKMTMEPGSWSAKEYLKENPDITLEVENAIKSLIMEQAHYELEADADNPDPNGDD
jgi:hypothetical protein